MYGEKSSSIVSLAPAFKMVAWAIYARTRNTKFFLKGNLLIFMALLRNLWPLLYHSSLFVILIGTQVIFHIYNIRLIRFF